MSDCVFCKIVAGEIPSHKVYEDDAVIAFLDISHFTVGHTLIIPKSHYTDLLDTPDEIIAKIAVLAKDLAANYKPTLRADGFNVKQNSGTVSGQEVMHYHVHLIPRCEGGKFKFAIQHKEKKVDLAEVAAKLRND